MISRKYFKDPSVFEKYFWSALKKELKSNFRDILRRFPTIYGRNSECPSYIHILFAAPSIANKLQATNYSVKEEKNKKKVTPLWFTPGI